MVSSAVLVLAGRTWQAGLSHACIPGAHLPPFSDLKRNATQLMHTTCNSQLIPVVSFPVLLYLSNHSIQLVNFFDQCASTPFQYLLLAACLECCSADSATKFVRAQESSRRPSRALPDPKNPEAADRPQLQTTGRQTIRSKLTTARPGPSLTPSNIVQQRQESADVQSTSATPTTPIFADGAHNFNTTQQQHRDSANVGKLRNCEPEPEKLNRNQQRRNQQRREAVKLSCKRCDIKQELRCLDTDSTSAAPTLPRTQPGTFTLLHLTCLYNFVCNFYIQTLKFYTQNTKILLQLPYQTWKRIVIRKAQLYYQYFVANQTHDPYFLSMLKASLTTPCYITCLVTTDHSPYSITSVYLTYSAISHFSITWHALLLTTAAYLSRDYLYLTYKTTIKIKKDRPFSCSNRVYNPTKVITDPSPLLVTSVHITYFSTWLALLLQSILLTSIHGMLYRKQKIVEGPKTT